MGDDALAWQRHLLAGMARLSGAGAAINFEGSWQPFRPTGFAEWGWENGFDRQTVLRMYEDFARRGVNQPMYFPYLAALGRRAGPSLTRAVLVSDGDWYRSSYYRDYHAPSGADAILWCILCQPGGYARTVGLVLVRPLGEKDFLPRHRTLAQAVATEVRTLIGGPLARFDEPSPAALPPRTRQVLRCLLEGDADKQVASRLGLTRHTVNQYIKVVFHHFGVSSRTELLARWIRRGWGNGSPGPTTKGKSQGTPGAKWS